MQTAQMENQKTAPFVNVAPGVPGIMGAMIGNPQVMGPFSAVAQSLLVDAAESPETTLSRGEREVIATFTSLYNRCIFCFNSHRAIAKALGVGENPITSKKMEILLLLAGEVAAGGGDRGPVAQTHADTVELAKLAGATERDIHDTVAIAAAFCMFNRYVSGLNLPLPEDNSYYAEAAEKIAVSGYGA